MAIALAASTTGGEPLSFEVEPCTCLHWYVAEGISWCSAMCRFLPPNGVFRREQCQLEDVKMEPLSWGFDVEMSC